MFLAGDIGGTKTHLGLFERENGRLVERTVQRFASASYDGLGVMVQEFLSGAGSPRVEQAAFGVPGPVIRGRSDATNLPWVLIASELEAQLAIEPVHLVNDLVATAAGLMDLPESAVLTLYPGTPHEHGSRAVLAPGTGLGQAGLIWDGTRYHPLPSEGGHADFAPRDEIEIELLRYLLSRQERVSYEHVLAGPGLTRIYEFLRETGRATEPPELADELARASDSNAVIGRAGLEDPGGICGQTLGIWTRVLGAEVGNLALRGLSIGGVYLGGGIVIKLLDKLRDGELVDAFLAKGRLRTLMQKIPVRVALDERAALLGAARIALGTFS